MHSRGLTWGKERAATQTRRHTKMLERLSPAEMAVFEEASAGKSIYEIATILNLSLITVVELYFKTIEKVGAETCVELSEIVHRRIRFPFARK